MALIGTLAINLTANTGRLSGGLNSSAKMVDAWSSRVGRSVDSAFSKLATPGASTAGVSSLSRGLATLANVSHKARTALDFADVGRFVGKASTGVAKLGLAFAGSGGAAVAMRAKVDAVSTTLSTLGAVSRKTRHALLYADAVGFLAKLGAVGGGALARVGSGLFNVAAGAARAVVGVAGVARGFYTAGANAGRFVKSLGGIVAGVVGRDFGKSFISTFEAFQSAGAAGAGLLRVGSGLASIASGALKAGAGVLKFGAGLAKLGISVVVSALSALKATIGGVASAFTSAVGSALKFGAVGGVIGAIVGVKLVRDASNLAESMNKVEVVFGKAGAAVFATADKLQDAFGLSKRAILDGASAFGGFLAGVGYAEKDSASLSIQMTRLAADMSSLRNIPLAEALTKIQAGLAGEAEPLRRFGVDLSDANVEAQALKMGLATAGEELTSSGKVQARIAIITQGLSKDMGDLARTADGPANAMREFWGRVEDLSATFGETLLPVAAAALGGINEAIVALKEAWMANRDVVVQWAATTAESLGLTGGGVGILQKAVGAVADAWQVVKAQATKALSYVAGGLSNALAGLAKFFEGLSYIGGGEWAVGVQRTLEGMSKQLEKGGEDLFKSFREQVKQPLASEGVDAFFDKAAKKIAGARAELAKPIAAKIEPPKGPAVVDEAAKKTKAGSDKAFGGAMLLGSTEAASTVLRSRYGASAKDGVAANTKRTADGVARLAAAQRDTNAILRDRAGGVAILGL